MGSPPQSETMGAPQSSTAFRHSSTVNISLIVDLYSRMRPQPVQVRLQAWSGSSIITSGNFCAPLIFLPVRYPAMLVVKLKGTLIHYPRVFFQSDAAAPPRESEYRQNSSGLCACCRNALGHRAGRSFDTDDI